ncbi:hypothetical protein [Oligoflexus tunisiensis]|uniref:hypothetical protein n=1 Tax=Oligoflexus tunisiensis TaxID=708132 RepID=UPI001C40824D|nr:hypothetical protein [Oligoflexus tunisiensis]
MKARPLNSSHDVRYNAVQLVNRVVSAVAKKSGGSCRLTADVMSIQKSSCASLGGVDLCVLGGRTAGYYVVTADSAGGAFVTFIRFD